jgi:serine/threonine-protein kinase RsbW
MDAAEATLTVVNGLPELGRAAAWLETVADAGGLPRAVTAKLQIALDEVLSNIITHGLADARAGSREIGLGVRVGGGQVELRVIDDGPAFDPAAAMDGAAGTRIAERREGGVGLLFVRALMDEVRVSRHDGRNHLVLYKRLAPPAT